MAAMNWNFDQKHINALVDIAKEYASYVRINTIKPVESSHMNLVLTALQYYEGFEHLLRLCDSVDFGEPPLAAVSGINNGQRCPCGRSSFRIHSITPDGCIYVSPCVYLHDYKSPMDLLKYPLADIINSPQFQVFRQRHAQPNLVEGCANCTLLETCGGGCSARSFLHHLHTTEIKSFTQRDPFCPKRLDFTASSFPFAKKVHPERRLVHMDYLCTWIGKPR
jgi:radical SAM protein with 4Fe4S-binding SPASM domain